MQYISKKDIILPKRKKSSKKGDNGKVLIVGGSNEYVGAVALAGLAALRSGVDWVTIAAPEKVAWVINSISPDLVTVKLKGDHFSAKHVKDIINLSKKYDVVLLGNGIGLKAETKKFIKKIINKINKLNVIDADAIKILSSNNLENSIITPHIRELQLFLKNSRINNKIINSIVNEKNIQKKVSLIRESLNQLNNEKNKKKIKINNFFERNNVVLLKGRVDAIISKDKVLFNKTGNAGMTKAGTGDVLAGLVAGFLAQNKSLMQSAINAAYFNGLVGDILLKKKKGFAYLASDMVEDICRVLKKR